MIENKTKGELIEFKTNDKYTLHGLLLSKKQKSVIVSIHGMGGNFYSGLSVKMSPTLMKNGFDVFLLNTRGHDVVSKVKKESKKYSDHIGTAHEKFEDSVYDVKAAIDAVQSLGYKNIILAGHSTGCQKAAYYIYKTKDRRVQAIILLAPCDDYLVYKKRLGRDWKQAAKKAKQWLRSHPTQYVTDEPGAYDAQRFNSISDLKRIESRLFYYDGNFREFSKIKTPMMVLFGTKEQNRTKPVESYINTLENETRSKRFGSVIIKNANHSFVGHEKKTAQHIANWLRSR